MKILDWVGTRKLESRWGTFPSGIVNVVVMLAIFMVLWRVFMDPRGIFRMYSPMYGYAYVQWMLVAVLTAWLVLRLWPLQQSGFLAKTHPLLKGSVFFGISALFMLFMVNGVLKSLIGGLSIPYFSEVSLLSLKQNAFNAREYSHQAITMLGGMTALVIPVWVLHLKNWPTREIPRGSGYLTSLTMIFFFAAIGYFLLYHPHLGILFYPWQFYAAAVPWWEGIANTLHSNFNLGLMMSWTAALWIIQVTYEGYPFKQYDDKPWRPLFGILGTLLFGLILFGGFHFLQEMAWGAPVRGGKLVGAVDWRYLHSGETSLFMLLIALIWGFYFKNWPRKYSMEVNFLVRTVIVGFGTFLFYTFYYKYNAVILGQQSGYSNPLQFPLAATSLIVALLLAHSWFFDMWPGEKVTNRQEFISESDPQPQDK